ncbi:related to transcription factor PLM2 [Lecanosticta acicola]|uniref:Related to transcription factor PLM2 n=1 Tax=Lecanosticta acicola TaxID=111012 RepID=A0AAI9EEX6_9PEZI|nr:related to transcription factor PLM2 [Lecanosticta acicola]
MEGLPHSAKPALPSTEANDALSRRPSLLPAFEPLSSSPGLPRPAKRKLDEVLDDRKYYPTPVPTSSTAILPSSPPSRLTRPGLQRAVSALSERAPLGDVPSLDLPANGEPMLMGRSSNSSDYQLSANRHISRVHVRASYMPPDEVYPNGKVEVECLGWNGAKVHCRGEIVELAKGELFESGKPMSQIIVDVQDTRVMLNWPKEDSRDPPSIESRSPWMANSPSRRETVLAPQFASSPPALLPPRPASPVSPTPGLYGLNFNVGVDTTFTSTFRADDEPVKVYQDHDSDEDAPHDPTPEPDCVGTPTPKRPSTAPTRDVKQSMASLASEQEELSEHDEENDPIVHSFGPFGDNIMSRFQSFQSSSPERNRKPLKSTFNSPGRSASAPQVSQSPVKNHVINQLAFSRIHALPLSTIHSNLPAELRGAMAKPSDNENPKVLSTSELKTILDGIPCVGEISREGKDAAGKLLESEFYYVPEMDVDANRRDTVMQSLGKTGIRAARKQHKQYYWKRPRY